MAGQLLMDIVDRMTQVILNITPDLEPQITFCEHDGDDELGLAMIEGDPFDATRTFIVIGDGDSNFGKFSGTEVDQDASVVVISVYITPGKGGFKRGRDLMTADRERFISEMFTPTIADGFSAVGNPNIDVRSTDMSQVTGKPMHVMTMGFNVNYTLNANC